MCPIIRARPSQPCCGPVKPSSVWSLRRLIRKQRILHAASGTFSTSVWQGVGRATPIRCAFCGRRTKQRFPGIGSPDPGFSLAGAGISAP
jgi:hypothetical protein